MCCKYKLKDSNTEIYKIADEVQDLKYQYSSFMQQSFVHVEIFYVNTFLVLFENTVSSRLIRDSLLSERDWNEYVVWGFSSHVFEEFDPLRSGGGRPTAETQQQHDRHQAHAAHGYMTADCRCWSRHKLIFL